MIIKIKKKLQFYFLPLLSGVLIGTSYIPFPPWALFFCYIPLWLFALKQKKLKTILIGSWLCLFIGTLIGFNWVAYTIREFGFFPWPLAILGLLIFAGFANLHTPIALFFWFLLQKKIGKNQQTLRLLLLPVFSALSMQYYPMIFEWHFGYTWLYANWPAAQTAEIWGFQFLNTLTFFFNFLFLFLFLRRNPNETTNCIKDIQFKNTIISLVNFLMRRKNIKSTENDTFHRYKYISCILTTGIFIFALLNVYGWYLKKRWPEPDKKAHILVVQPNLENLTKAYKRSKEDPRPDLLSKLVRETKKNIHKDFNFILWPEGAYPYRIRYERNNVQKSFVQEQAEKWQVPVVLSATGRNSTGTTNSIFVFDEKGELVQSPYNKTLLLAFGEYFPGERWLPVNKLFGYYGRSFQRGTGENKVIKLNKINLGMQICYEGLFDFFTRDLVKENAQILVNVTNDSWYGSWQQPWQHLYMTLARAIEVRRPLVRGTNTGLSAFISAKGEIKNISTINKEISWVQEVPYYSLGTVKKSTFTLWGYYINQCFLWGLFSLSFFIFFLGKMNKNK